MDDHFFRIVYLLQDIVNEVYNRQEKYQQGGMSPNSLEMKSLESYWIRMAKIMDEVAKAGGDYKKLYKQEGNADGH